MIVDRIEPLDKRRCKVFLDGDFAFVLYKGEIRRYRLTEGEELSPSLYQEIFNEVILKRTRERALYLLQFSGRTEAELTKKLTDSFYPERAVRATVDFLKRYHYLDDEKFARNYIEIYGNKKSRAELKKALFHKGVDRECVEQLLSEQEPDERLQVKRLLEKRRYSSDMPLKDKQKTVAFLMRRGFSYETVRSEMELFSAADFFE